MISGAKARLTKAHARIGAALLLVGVLALSAEGDVSGGHSIGGDDAPQRRAGEIGFTYSAWLKDRRAYSGIDTIGEDSALSAGGEKPGSFWGDVAMRLGDNAVERARGSLLGIFPRGSELRDILLRYGNGEEFDMAQWREIRKRRLQESFRFAPVAFYADAEGALANAFSDTVVDRLAFVRRARIDFRTSLGGRSGNIGVDAAGAFRARDDDVIGWQLRAFGAQGGKGGNAGAYYRRVWGDALAGINIFADYEDDNTDGSFWRWSLGGEVKSRYGEISANHYFAVTDPRLLADGGYVYSRGGYDAEVAFRVPRAEWLRAHLSYYNFKGEFGDADDDGLRLGLDFEPGGGLVVGVEYDEGSGDFGGNIAFERNFGEPLRPAANAGTFDPRAHFFDLVRREYTQRITRTESSNPLEFYLTTSQISLMVDAPAVAAVVGGEGVAASPAVVGFTATVSPGPPFAVVGRADDVDISLAGLSRYILTLSDLTLETQSTTVNNAAAVFNQGFGIWVLTLRQSTRVAFDRRGILSVAFGSGVFERFRPEVISAVISEGATLDLAGTRIGWTTILNAGNVSVVFNVRAGAATVGVTTGGSVNIQNRATAILDIGGGTMRALSCDNLPSAGDISPNIRFACEAANASPVAIVGGGTDGRAVVPAELAAATLVATLINLGGAHTNYIFDVISGGDFIAMSEADSNGVVEISVLANPRVGDTEIVVGIRDIGGDDTNDTRRTVRVRVLEPLGLATTPTGRITITTQQSIGQELYIMRGIGGDGNYTFGLAGAVAGFEVSGSLVINNMTVNTAVLETLYLFVRDSFGTGATLTATIRVAHPPQLTLDLSDISPVVASADMFIQAGMADVSGGLEPKFTVEYDTTAGDISITINADSGLLEVRGRELIQLTITIVASDRHTRVNDVMDTRVISISPGLVLPLPAELASGGARVTTYGGFDISRVSLATFRGETRFTVQGYSLLNNYGGILALTPQSGGATRLDYVANSNAAAARMIAVSVEVRDNSPQGAPGSTPNMATATFNVTIVNPPALRLSSVNDTQNTGHRINVDRVVLLATVGGGFVRTDADYTFAVLPSDVGARLSAGSRGDESRFLYYRARTPATITVSISANDRHNNTPAATLPVTLTAIPLPVGFNTGNINTIIATAQG
ncbi:MAG: inverse autotransporter beta domain-containing protein, partial [Gammaproteobacteria bacterium]